MKVRLILEIKDEAYPHIFYLLKHMEGVEIVEDSYSEEAQLQKYLNECDKHLQRIEEAYADIEQIIPLSVQKYKMLSKDEVQAIDQYLYRFSKLQDTLGQRVFRLVYKIYEPFEENITFIDLLNRLEKLGFLENTKEWINLRDKRNQIAHQYDDEPYEMTQAINALLNQKNILKAIYLKIKNKIETLHKDENR